MQQYEVVYQGPHNIDWLRARQGGIGASDAPGIMGADGRWSSKYSVWVDKLSPAVDDTDSEAARWGRLLEPVIRDEFARVTKRAVRPDGRILRSCRWPHLTCTLDAVSIGLTGGPTVVEIKNYRFRPPDMPRKLWIQIQAQLAVTGYRAGSYAVLVSGQEFFWGDVERDDDWIETAWLPASLELWGRVQKGGPPPAPSADVATQEALKRWFPSDTGETVPLSGVLLDRTWDRERLVAERGKLQAEIDAIDIEVKAAIGSATRGVLPDGRAYTWRADKSGRRKFLAPRMKAE